jgi:hypothetical protein
MNPYQLIGNLRRNGNANPAPIVRKLRRASLTLDERQVRALEQIADALTLIARELEITVAAADVEDDGDLWAEP